MNISTHYIYADLVIHDYDEDLLGFIISPDSISTDKRPEMIEKSKEWGNTLLDAVVINFNKIILYARSLKGQFWLQEYLLGEDYFMHFEAMGKIGDGEWFRFDPIIEKSFTIIMPSSYERYFDEKSWHQAKDFVLSESRPDFYLVLLSEAELFQSKGNNRVALTEAVSALETMVYKFASDKKSPLYFPQEISERMGFSSLNNTVRHLGLTATINYLFPILFKEEQIPQKTLNDCQEAIVTRGNIVHNGQKRCRY